MRTIKAVIFDMDGLMFDTERLAADCWAQAGREDGLEVGEEFLSHIRGSSKEEAEEWFCTCFGKEYDYWRLRDRKTELFRGCLDTMEIPVKKGLRELLIYLKEHEYTVALGTSTAKRYALQYLESADVMRYFDVFVCGDMVIHCKPSPEIFYRAAGEAGCSPDECVVLEDSLNGIRAAIDGGFIPVMIPDITQPSGELEAEVAACLNNLLEVIGFLEESDAKG